MSLFLKKYKNSFLNEFHQDNLINSFSKTKETSLSFSEIEKILKMEDEDINRIFILFFLSILSCCFLASVFSIFLFEIFNFKNFLIHNLSFLFIIGLSIKDVYLFLGHELLYDIKKNERKIQKIYKIFLNESFDSFLEYEKEKLYKNLGDLNIKETNNEVYFQVEKSIKNLELEFFQLQYDINKNNKRKTFVNTPFLNFGIYIKKIENKIKDISDIHKFNEKNEKD